MIKIIIAVFVVGLLTGCSFQIGIEYTGKSAKDDRHFTPNKELLKQSTKY